MDIRDSIGLPIESDDRKISYNSSEIDVKNIISFQKKDLRNYVKEPNWGENEDNQDVFRLYQILSSDVEIEIPQSITNDMRMFLEIILEEPPDLKNLGIRNAALEEVLESIRNIYSL